MELKRYFCSLVLLYYTKTIRLHRKFFGVMSVSDYRKFLRKRYKENPELWFSDNY